jgi:SHS2 domain-containing protein
MQPSHLPDSEDLPPWLEPMDHTADIGIKVSAGDPRELFARAAWAMFSLITDLRRVRPAESAEVRAEADDREALMVRWLSELNFLHQTRHVLFCRFDVSRLVPTSIEATVRGEEIDPARHQVHSEIKAVTFHELHVEERNGSWTATVLFDV